MLFIGNLLTDYYHSFIHSYSPFLTLLTLPLRSRRADFVLFVFLSLLLMPDSSKRYLYLIESARILSAKEFPEMYASARPGPRVKRKISSPTGSIFHFSLADPISYLIWLKRSGR
jgi:hypothetical protein